MGGFGVPNPKVQVISIARYAGAEFFPLYFIFNENQTRNMANGKYYGFATVTIAYLITLSLSLYPFWKT